VHPGKRWEKALRLERTGAERHCGESTPATSGVGSAKATTLRGQSQSKGHTVQKLKTFLDRDFFESDDTNKVAMGMGFVAGVAMLLGVVGLGLMF